MSDEYFEAARKEMVAVQLARRGISDRKVLAAFRKVPRELFVPEGVKRFAYQDGPLAIGQGQTISQPYIVALMTELLRVEPGNSVLEIGTGSGYQSAILLSLGVRLFSVERYLSLAEKAKKSISRLGYDLNVKVSDGTLGWAEFSPYDKIIITAASPAVPESIKKQVKIGGRMVAPLGPRDNQQLTVIDKLDENKFKSRAACGCVFVPLIGKEGWDG